MAGTDRPGSGAAARCWVLKDREHFLGLRGLIFAPAFGWWRGGCRPYFENYTVDASILKKRT
ncbi:hypothetical protein GCM10027064_26300 [Microbacterium petrolearium]